jgi:hypothetical protein
MGPTGCEKVVKLTGANSIPKKNMLPCKIIAKIAVS